MRTVLLLALCVGFVPTAAHAESPTALSMTRYFPRRAHRSAYTVQPFLVRGFRTSRYRTMPFIKRDTLGRPSEPFSGYFPQHGFRPRGALVD